jgi:hypothetical protein
MHASDRYLAPGATLEDLRQGDGATGYASALKHGQTGKGLNDYDATLRNPGRTPDFNGWISVEAGMEGLDRNSGFSRISEVAAEDVLQLESICQRQALSDWAGRRRARMAGGCAPRLAFAVFSILTLALRDWRDDGHLLPGPIRP